MGIEIKDERLGRGPIISTLKPCTAFMHDGELYLTVCEEEGGNFMNCMNLKSGCDTSFHWETKVELVDITIIIKPRGV